ncbi:Heterodisulfide reductase subunit A-like protein [uncultured archaeon]|nr:Heterodisulfide reductase subunit A-like protein [uncultured archaeon]
MRFNRKMSKVYFSEDLDKILETIDYSKLGKNVAIKVHFGEKGCTTYLDPEIAKKVYEKIISLGKKAALVDCNVLYKGSRTNTTDHIKTAKEHGFGFAPIDILDGELGEEFIEVNGCKIGAGIKKYDSMIVLTHFKGHGETGYGGAFKNIGMGLGSRAGKLQMHGDLKLSVIKEKCIGCGVCKAHCNYGAIEIINGKAEINQEKCVGCSMCVAVCEQRAVNLPWAEVASEKVQKRIIDYAESVLRLVPNQIFISVLKNITPECDCWDIVQKPVMADIGFLYSEDIVSIDKASLYLANKKSEGNFDKINSVNKNIQVDYAYEKKLGEKEYELIELK